MNALLAHDLVDEAYLHMYPLTLGSGKRVIPDGLHTTFQVKSSQVYPSGVLGLLLVRQR